MTAFDFSNLGTSFVQWRGYDFDSFVSANANFYTWTTNGGHTIIARGTGITHANGVPTGGTITSIEIILGTTDPTIVDVTITDIDSILLTDLIQPDEQFNGDLFWAALQTGPVNITESDTDRAILFNFAGPGLLDGILRVADNSAEGFFAGTSKLSGGVDAAEGGLLIGGDFDFTGNAGDLFGDAVLARRDAVVVGGDDHFKFDSSASAFRDKYFGDVGEAREDAQIFGGDDILDMRTTGATDAQVFGDLRIATNDNVLLVGGGDGENVLYGGDGRDKFFFGSGVEFGVGGNGNDLFLMGLGETGVNGGNGFDKVTYFRQEVNLTITWSGDIATAKSTDFLGDHTIVSIGSYSGSNTGADRVVTDDTTLTINTNGGNDVYIAGDQSSDTVNLGDGDDIARGSVSRNTMDGGAGRDTLTYSTSDEGVTVDLAANFVSGGNARFDTIANFEQVNGSNGGEDRLFGTDTGNVIKGLGGEDDLFGRGGTDKLYGGSQSDFLNGGQGTDYLFGGSGRDTFHFNKDDDRDIIRDFQNNADRIELDGFAADFDWRDVASQQGDDVVLNFGGGDRLIIEDALIGQLGNDLFVV